MTVVEGFSFTRILEPGWTMEMVERLDGVAEESSNGWNNAGTGHAGLCELNYTPQAADGSVDIKKAVHINTQFEVSKQFWTYLTKKGTFGSSKSFIAPVPHLSFVQGDKGVEFLKKRFELMRHDETFPLYVEADEIYNMACPASPVHYQYNPIKTMKTSVIGIIHILGMARSHILND